MTDPGLPAVCVAEGVGPAVGRHACHGEMVRRRRAAPHHYGDVDRPVRITAWPLAGARAGDSTARVTDIALAGSTDELKAIR